MVIEVWKGIFDDDHDSIYCNGQPRPLWQLFFGIIDSRSHIPSHCRSTSLVVWMAPLLVLILSLAVLLIVQTPHTLELARQQIESQLAAMPEDQVEAARPGWR